MGQASSSPSTSPIAPRTTALPRNYRGNSRENEHERFISTETTQLLTPDPEEDIEGDADVRSGDGHRSMVIGRHDGHACYHPHAIGDICYPQDEFGDLPVYKTIHRFVS